VVSSTPRPHFTTGKDPVPIVQEAGWAPGPVWTGGNLGPTGIRSPDRPARSQSLCRLSYPAQHFIVLLRQNTNSLKSRRFISWPRLEVSTSTKEIKSARSGPARCKYHLQTVDCTTYKVCRLYTKTTLE
jgi:hypothetical protein